MPGAKNLLAVVGWTDGESQERETSAGGGNVCWEDRLSLDSVLWDVEERLGAVEMEAHDLAPTKPLACSRAGKHTLG